VPRDNYRLGVPERGFWREIFNSDAKHYGGSGRGNFGGMKTTPLGLHGRSHSITIDLPPLGAVFLRKEVD
jgi:1,4-alpha-glucan branching enzyme